MRSETLPADHKFEVEPSMSTYRRGCRCHLCRAFNAENQREYQARRKALRQNEVTGDQVRPEKTA